MKHSLTKLRRSLAATLAISGAVLIVAPAIGQVAAGTNISNTATATYQDPNNPDETIDATSNTVEIVVAEVAGITVEADGITDSTPGTNLFPGDVATFDFLITNTGNDTTTVSIPDPVIAGPVTPGTPTFDIDADGDGTFEQTGVDEATAEAAVLSPGGQILASIPVTVNNTAPSGADISVQLGDADGNQNEAADTVPADNTDVLTVDAEGEPGDVAGAPVNGEREASATQETVVGAQPLAFSTVLKTASNVAPNGTPNVFDDDTITYDLELRVESTAPVGSDPGLVPADLKGTTVTGIGANFVLVSDAIPAGTTFDSATSTNANWVPVFTQDATTTNANDATWSLTAPGDLTTVTRVGFVYDAGTNGPIEAGTTESGFSIDVVTTGLNATSGGTVANLAQSFGETEGVDDGTVVYDESGDQNPTNFNDDGSQGPNTGADDDGDGVLDPVIDDGVADPGVNGVDTDNNNEGDGVGGEDNVVSLGPDAGILNGPEGAPGATGPTDNNDDFTNQSSDVPAGTAPNTLIDPDPVTFTNTIQATDGTLDDVIIFPDDGDDTETLPEGTTVTLEFGGDTATYTYQDTDSDGDPDTFILTSGSAIQIGTIPDGGSVDYTVTVDLPADTPLSTDEPAAFPDGFPVPIVAVEDTDSNGEVTDGEANNTTINRVYTGYLKLEKSAVLRDATSNASKPLDEAGAGDFIDYTVEYTNISSSGGSGSVLLDADNVVIEENGTAGGNTWALDADTNGFIDTENVPGTASDSGSGTITFFNGSDGSNAASDLDGNTQANDVTRYVDTLSLPVEPGDSGTLTFTRQISEE